MTTTDETQVQVIDTEGVHFVATTDGSCRGNPGYGGYGVYGYTYKYSTRNKNIKHPTHATLFFTRNGVQTTRDESNLEVIGLYEVIKSINNPLSTNNEAELLGFITALNKAATVDNLKSIKIFTDSNYIVTAFNENIEKWKLNDWRRQDNKPIVHKQAWMTIDDFKNKFNQAGVTVEAIWVKGHSDDYSNIVADIYSVVGSNSAKRQLTSTSTTFNETILDTYLSYADYKKSYINKDIILYFRELYFSSNALDDTHYCFLSTSDNPHTVGKRDTSSIFVTNIGYVPTFVNELKKIFRAIPRVYTTTCCVKLNRLENKDILRLTNLVNAEDLLVHQLNPSGVVSYALVGGDNTPFIYENGYDYPFMISATGLFSRMMDIVATHEDTPLRLIKDITPRIVQDGKIVFSNKEKHLDFTDVIDERFNLKEKLYVTVGYDIPSYLALKNIEADIQSVQLILDAKPDSNFCTLYLNINTADRNIYTVNIENKFLRR
jgi:ribonuclease HI